MSDFPARPDYVIPVRWPTSEDLEELRTGLAHEEHRLTRWLRSNTIFSWFLWPPAGIARQPTDTLRYNMRLNPFSRGGKSQVTRDQRDSFGVMDVSQYGVRENYEPTAVLVEALGNAPLFLRKPRSEALRNHFYGVSWFQDLKITMRRLEGEGVFEADADCSRHLSLLQFLDCRIDIRENPSFRLRMFAFDGILVAEHEFDPSTVARGPPCINKAHARSMTLKLCRDV